MNQQNEYKREQSVIQETKKVNHRKGKIYTRFRYTTA